MNPKKRKYYPKIASEKFGKFDQLARCPIIPILIHVFFSSLAWVCDICQLAKFRSHDDAQTHEELCTGVFDPAISQNAAHVCKSFMFICMFI